MSYFSTPDSYERVYLLWPEYSTGGRRDSIGIWHIECGRTDKRWLLRFLLPVHTERGEQYDTLHGQEDGHFLTLWGLYNSLMVDRPCLYRWGSPLGS